MRIATFEPNRIVTYTSTQPGLPDASHDRRFEPDDGGFVYRLGVEYTPRSGLPAPLDRFLLPRAIRRAFQRTFVALEREFEHASTRAISQNKTWHSTDEAVARTLP